jgi:Lon protease-like protein
MQHDLTERRRWYAQDLKLRAPVRRHMVIAEAFAAVPRERFLGPGPWRLLPDRYLDNVFVTPDDDPRWLCHDVLVTIDKTRGLNNGLPSLWARSFDHIDWRRQKRVLQVGAGTGYYAAVLAEIVGPTGRVIAVECDTQPPWSSLGSGRAVALRRGRPPADRQPGGIRLLGQITRATSTSTRRCSDWAGCGVGRGCRRGLTRKRTLAIVLTGRYDPLLAPPLGYGERIALRQASFARRSSQQCKRLTLNSPQQRKGPMRDFRDAKAMAQTLRDVLKAKSITLTNSESLELIAKILAFHDWNELSARIQSEQSQALTNRAPIKLPRPAVPLPAGTDLPVVPMRDIVMFPNMIAPLFVRREKTTRALDCAMAADKRFVAVTQRRAGDDDPTQEALYGVGVIASVIDLTVFGDTNVRTTVKGLERVTLACCVGEDMLGAKIAAFTESRGDGTQAESLVRTVRERLRAYLNVDYSSLPYSRLLHIRKPGVLADAIAPLMPMEIGQRQELLEAGDATARLEKVLALMENDHRAA